MEKFTFKKSVGILSLHAHLHDFSYKTHAHEEYAIGVTMRGIQQYHLNGALQLSHKNGVMLFNPEQMHDGAAHNKEGLDYRMLYIEPSLLLEATEQKELIVFSEPIVYDQQLSSRVLQLSSAIATGNDALSYERFLSLADRLQTRDFVTFPHDSKKLACIKELLHTHLDGVLSLEWIAEEVALSKFQLIRYFKQHVGIKPYQYFLNCKIAYAKQLLEQTKDVYAAVVGCGFTDLTHLNRHFKYVYGITAFDYAQQMH